jgi:hypothetical protein
MKLRSGVLVSVSFLTSIGYAEAATMLRAEPPKGKLPVGETVYVDNGRCPHGKVLEVTGGGNHSLRTGNVTAGAKRSYRCVVRPAG